MRTIAFCITKIGLQWIESKLDETTIKHGPAQVTATKIESVAAKWEKAVIIASNAVIFIV